MHKVLQSGSHLRNLQMRVAFFEVRLKKFGVSIIVTFKNALS